jgi:hypothetical protein
VRRRFSALPGGRSFAQVVARPERVDQLTIPGNAALRFGATLENEVALSQYSCRMGQRNADTPGRLCR